MHDMCWLRFESILNQFCLLSQNGGIFFPGGGISSWGGFELLLCCVADSASGATFEHVFSLRWLIIYAFDVTSKLIGWNFCNGNPVWEKKIRSRGRGSAVAHARCAWLAAGARFVYNTNHVGVIMYFCIHVHYIRYVRMTSSHTTLALNAKIISVTKVKYTLLSKWTCVPSYLRLLHGLIK